MCVRASPLYRQPTAREMQDRGCIRIQVGHQSDVSPHNPDKKVKKNDKRKENRETLGYRAVGQYFMSELRPPPPSEMVAERNPT